MPLINHHSQERQTGHESILCTRTPTQDYQFRFNKYFVFLIKIKYFSFKIFRYTVSGCTVYIYIYIYKLIINYAIQTQCQTNIILKFKIFLNSQD